MLRDYGVGAACPLYTHELLDVTQYELDRVRPASIIERQGAEVWAVREQPVDTAGSPRYLWCEEASHVYIPLFPYLTPPEPIMTVAKGDQSLQIFLEFLDWAGPRASRLAIQRVHRVWGCPVQDLSNRLRFWYGIAFMFREDRHDG